MRLFVRGKVWTASWWFGGKRYCRSTGMKSRRAASAVAQGFLEAQRSGRTDLLEATKIRRTVPTIEKVCELYLAGARCRQKTAKENVYKLSSLCQLVNIPLSSSVLVLGEGFPMAVQKAGRAAGWRDTSIHTYIRQARSVFARYILPTYGLPEAPGWLRSSSPSPGRVMGFQPFPTAAWRALCRDVVRLRNSGDLALWRAFLLMARCGMGNDEVVNARGSWLVANGIRIEERPGWKPKSHNRERTIPMRPARFKKWFASSAGSDELLVEFGKEAIYRRLNPLVRKHLPGRQKAAYELRKHAGSIVATRDGIFAASKFLGDNVATVEKFYAAMLKPLRPI